MIQEETKDKTGKRVVVRGKDLPISTKHAIAICAALKGKRVDEALTLLEKVQQQKLAIPFKGEIPHRHGMAGGRYPVKAAAVFLKLLRGLRAAASRAGLDAEKLKIAAKADRAARAARPGGRRRRRFKRSHVLIIAEQEEK